MDADAVGPVRVQLLREDWKAILRAVQGEGSLRRRLRLILELAAGDVTRDKAVRELEDSASPSTETTKFKRSADRITEVGE